MVTEREGWDGASARPQIFHVLVALPHPSPGTENKAQGSHRPHFQDRDLPPREADHPREDPQLPGRALPSRPGGEQGPRGGGLEPERKALLTECV